MISFEGIPAVYFNSLFGKSNDEAKYVITGNNRDVNRYKWNYKNISKKLDNKNSKQSIFYQKISNLLSVKRKQKAFHPNASRQNINLGTKIFSFKRISLNKWSKGLPNRKFGNNYLNFIASHDGIGMRPTEGILNKKTLNNFLKRLKKNGSKFSYRKVQNKSKKVYEANITVFDALKK